MLWGFDFFLSENHLRLEISVNESKTVAVTEVSTQLTVNHRDRKTHDLLYFLGLLSDLYDAHGAGRGFELDSMCGRCALEIAP